VIGFFRRLSDERYRRAQKRRRTEEIMGWICVPILLLIVWSAWRMWEEANAGRAQLRDPVIPATTTILRN
jgi:uncharacterized membrane protein